MARRKVEGRFLLPADAARLIVEAEASRNLPDTATDEAGRAVVARLCGG